MSYEVFRDNLEHYVTDLLVRVAGRVRRLILEECAEERNIQEAYTLIDQLPFPPDDFNILFTSYASSICNRKGIAWVEEHKPLVERLQPHIDTLSETDRSGFSLIAGTLPLDRIAEMDVERFQEVVAALPAVGMVYESEKIDHFYKKLVDPSTERDETFQEEISNLAHWYTTYQSLEKKYRDKWLELTKHNRWPESDGDDHGLVEMSAISATQFVEAYDVYAQLERYGELAFLYEMLEEIKVKKDLTDWIEENKQKVEPLREAFAEKPWLFYQIVSNYFDRSTEIALLPSQDLSEVRRAYEMVLKKRSDGEGILDQFGKGIKASYEAGCVGNWAREVIDELSKRREEIGGANYREVSI